MKAYLVSEHYFPKKENFDDVMNLLKETSAMLENQDGALMSMSLKPEQKNGAITSITLW